MLHREGVWACAVCEVHVPPTPPLAAPCRPLPHSAPFLLFLAPCHIQVTKLPPDPDHVHVPPSAAAPHTYPTDTPYRKPPSPARGADHAHAHAFASTATAAAGGDGFGPGAGMGMWFQGAGGSQAHWGVEEDPVDLVRLVSTCYSLRRLSLISTLSPLLSPWPLSHI